MLRGQLTETASRIARVITAPSCAAVREAQHAAPHAPCRVSPSPVISFHAGVLNRQPGLELAHWMVQAILKAERYEPRPRGTGRVHLRHKALRTERARRSSNQLSHERALSRSKRTSVDVLCASMVTAMTNVAAQLPEYSERPVQSTRTVQ